MHRSVLLLLISVFVLSAASVLPVSVEKSLEESLEEDSQHELKAESVEKVDSIELPKASDSSSEEQKDVDKDKVEFDIDPVSSEEDNQSEETVERSMEVAPRRRRSAEREKFRNLRLLATICPKKDFKDLEKSSSISFRIEIEDMYAVCAQLKDRQSYEFK